MRLVFGGAEVPSNKNALLRAEVEDIAVSFIGMSRRLKFARPWYLSEHYPDEVSILLDSGAYSVNRDEDKYTQRELREIAEKYKTFVEWNIDRVEGVIEFDALPLGREWIEKEREDFYDRLPEGKFVPVWHPEFGLEYLSELATRYRRVAVPSVDLSGRDLTPLLNRLANSGVKLHGISMTKPDIMQAVIWDSVSSLSWLSPQMNGDTIVWTGRELKRYPKKQKEQARKRYRTLFDKNGFDHEKIAADDDKELLRLSIWSWRQLVDYINEKGHVAVKEVTPLPGVDTLPIPEIEPVGVDNLPSETRKSVSTREIVTTRETVPLPVLAVTLVEESNEEGETQTHQEVTLRSSSQRICDNCFLSKNCPGYEPASTCAYDIPIKISTTLQMKKLHEAMIEMQAQRVMFMRMAEEQEGGYADPNLSIELDRLNKMIKSKYDMETDKFSMTLDVKATGGAAQATALSRLFGTDASNKAMALPGGPVSVEEAANIIEGEVIGES